MVVIDTTFDIRNVTDGGDPDKCSPTIKQYIDYYVEIY